MDLNELGYTVDEQIFYGVYTLYLYPCTGTYNEFNIQDAIKEELNDDTIKEALKNLEDLRHINKNYIDYYLPCIPETNIKLNAKEENKPLKNNLIANPLIKFNLNMNKLSKEFEKVNKFIGITSGKRSCIIKNKSGEFLRLKGCGNYKSGFTLLEYENANLNVNDLPFKKIEIRGCQFENTVFRELYYSYKVSEILKKHNMYCANFPLGYFKYDKDIKFIEESLKVKNTIINKVPEVDKYCSIYKTLGDRRLGSHLLKGIEIILDAIIETAINEFNLDQSAYDDIYMLFSERRRKFSVISEYAIREVYLPENKSIKEWCDKPIYKSEFYENLINYRLMLEHFNSNENLIKIKNSSNLIEKWSKIIENKNYFKYEQFQALIDELIKMDFHNKKKSILEYIHDIFIRIGYETAKIKRIFQDEDFNWGTYNGQGPSDIFCSAHFNNFVVLPGKYSCLLAPIDFDLAFERKNFINNDKVSKSFGKKDNYVFDKFLNREINTLLYNIINVKGPEYYKNQNMKEQLKDLIYFLLNDSLIESYMKTFDKIELDHLEKYFPNGVIEILVKLSLILTYNIIS